MVGLQCVFVVRSSGVLGLPYKKQLCLPTDYHCVNSLALEDCHCNSSEIAYQSSRKRRITRNGTHIFSLGRMIYTRREFRVRMFF